MTSNPNPVDLKTALTLVDTAPVYDPNEPYHEGSEGSDNEAESSGFVFQSTDELFEQKPREWVIEGKGVSPDIEVDNDPTGTKDAQLERGIVEVLKRINANPKTLPKRPAAPVKSLR